MNTVNECGIVLLNSTCDHILIIYQNQSLKWGLPKGHMEKNEIINKQYFSCAKRELLEETGIMLSTHKYRKLGTVMVKDKLFYIIYLMKNIKLKKPLDTKEIGDIKWLSVYNIKSFINTYNCNVTLKEFNKYLPIISGSHHKISNAQMV
jgi:hypothetical protein